MQSLEAVRARASAFCVERSWQQFHTPTNLCLALVGEVGEVCETLQWKGSNFDVSTGLTAEERTHIGEELADVFIYSTRLCQQSRVDLAKCTSSFIKSQGVLTEFDVRPDSEESWDTSVTFDLINSVLVLRETNPRFFCMKLAAQSGVVADLFTVNMESESGLATWSDSQLRSFGFTMASIVIILASIGKLVGLELSSCISNKMDKNEKKYPVALSKGSSAKYTAYSAQISSSSSSSSSSNSSLFKQTGGGLLATGIFLLGILLGRRLPPIRF